MSKKKRAPKYAWKAGGGEFRAHDANAVGEELARIRTARGQLTPADVVDAAADPKSPLHPLLPWDDTEAARLGREMIAARIVRSVTVTIVQPAAPPITTRAFVSKPVGGRDRSYSVVEDELATEEGRAMLLRQAWLQLKAWKARFGQLNELAQIFDAIDAAERVAKAG